MCERECVSEWERMCLYKNVNYLSTEKACVFGKNMFQHVLLILIIYHWVTQSLVCACFYFSFTCCHTFASATMVISIHANKAYLSEGVYNMQCVSLNA